MDAASFCVTAVLSKGLSREQKKRFGVVLPLSDLCVALMMADLAGGKLLVSIKSEIGPNQSNI